MQNHKQYQVRTSPPITNHQSKDAHWFYNPQTDRVISRRSFNRVAGISKDRLIGNKMTGSLTDENGKEWDFIKGPKEYDVWQRGATPEAIAMDPQKYHMNWSLLIPPTIK